ncbi:MAG: class I SAM-dependent methyltransferase family protein [Desulfurococcaceae archaeon]|nr:class I SAM-dependent methyltransferase family protein [Desulfurococcaceae archaeon]
MTRGDLLKRVAREVLGEDFARRIWRRIEFIGDIALIRTPLNMNPEELRPLGEEILNRIPHVKSVWASIPGIEGPYRLRRHVWLAGEQRSETLYREHGCVFKVDINRVYISPSLNYEHIRVARLVNPGEVVFNMFAGAGLFSIIIAKHSNPSRVYSVDINPDAYYYMVENIKLNHVEDKVHPVLGDAKDVASKLSSSVNRVLMPYPELALDYLPYAVDSLKNSGWVHVYLHVRTERGEHWRTKALRVISERLAEISARSYTVSHVRKIRNVGPRQHQVVVDLYIAK